MAFEIPTELGRTGIANFGGNNGKCALTSCDHQPGFVQPQRLEILNRGVPGEALKADVI